MTEEEQLFAAAAEAVKTYIKSYAAIIGYELAEGEADSMYERTVDALIGATDSITVQNAFLD